MTLLTGTSLSHALRQSVDDSTVRLWIASPYIGGWAGQVRRILGTSWQSKVGDVRLLTDIDAEGFKMSTMRQFFRRGEVRTLTGLHAKLYIADDRVILTSANLTGTAFSKRYEAGILLTGAPAKRAVGMFESWWKQPGAIPLVEDQLHEPPKARNKADGPPTSPLPLLNDLPPDIADDPLPADRFGDYSTFLDAFGELAGIYREKQRLWKQVPLNFEVDAFLNYLYHHAPGTPSRAYAKKPPRALSAQQRRKEIHRYATAFATFLESGTGGDSSAWRMKSSRDVRRLLNANRKTGLSGKEIKELLRQLNSLQTFGMNLASITKREINPLKDIRATLRHLVDESIPLQRRMSDTMGQVRGLGKSSIQELVGFYYAGSLPLRNQNVNCGLRFLGFNVRVA